MTKPNDHPHEVTIIPNSAADPEARAAAEEAIEKRIAELDAESSQVMGQFNAMVDLGATEDDATALALRERFYDLEDQIHKLKCDLELGIQADLQAVRGGPIRYRFYRITYTSGRDSQRKTYEPVSSLSEADLRQSHLDDNDRDILIQDLGPATEADWEADQRRCSRGD